MIRTLQLGQLGFSSATASTTPPVVYTTLNPADKHSQVLLSGGNLIATTNTPNSGIVRAVDGKSTGKYYFEAVPTSNGSAASDEVGVGLANASHSLTAALGFSNVNGWAMWGWSGSGYRHNGLVLANTGMTPSSVIGFAVDLDNDQLWVSVGGAWIQGDPNTATSPLSTNLTGTIYPAACPWKANSVTMRFDPASHTYGAPTGFTPGWPV